MRKFGARNKTTNQNNQMKRILLILCVITSVMTGCKKDDIANILAKSITISLDKLNLDMGERYLLNCTILPSDVTDQTITWTSTNKSIATISKEGLVTAVSAGQVFIMASTKNSKIATCILKVDPAPLNPCVFTNNTENPQYIMLMGSVLTYCEVDGVVKEIKEYHHLPNTNVPSNLKTASQMISSRKEQSGDFINIPVGKSIKIYDQTKIEYITLDEFTTDCDFSQWTGLMSWNCSELHCPVLDFRNSPKLDFISIISAPSITRIDISNCTQLQYFDVWNCNIEVADFSKCGILKHCTCMCNKVKKIDLSNSPLCYEVEVGNEGEVPCALEEIIICPKLQKTRYYMFSSRGFFATNHKNFKIRFLINKDPNTPDLEERYNQVFDRLTYMDFYGEYILQTQAGEPCWNYNLETLMWTQDSRK